MSRVIGTVGAASGALATLAPAPLLPAVVGDSIAAGGVAGLRGGIPGVYGKSGSATYPGVWGASGHGNRVHGSNLGQRICRCRRRGF